MGILLNCALKHSAGYMKEQSLENAREIAGSVVTDRLTNHGKIVCKECKKIIAQCRCIGCDKTVTESLCDECAKRLTGWLPND